MRYCSLVELQPGMLLGRHVYGFKGDLLLGRGNKLDDYFIARLASLGFPGVYVEEAGFEEVQPPELIDVALRASTEVLLGQCFEDLVHLKASSGPDTESLQQTLIDHPELRRSLPVGKVRSQVNQVVQEITDQFTTELPCLLLKSQSQYLVQHATDVMLISILLGVNFNLIYRELRQLGLAALLHDVGKCVLTAEGETILGPEHSKYKEHPYVGAQLVLNSGDDLFTECATIQQHHERQDGAGFPDGLKGERKSPAHSRSYQAGKIYRLAEIVSVADAYDVLTSGSYGLMLSPEAALQELIRRSENEFNPHVVSMLVKTIQIFPVGSQVRIEKTSDPHIRNMRGIVSQFRPEAPHQCDLILCHDATGKRVTPSKVSLAGDERARLALVL